MEITLWVWLRRWRWGLAALVVVALVPLAQARLPVVLGAVVVAIASAIFDVLWQRMREQRASRGVAREQVLVGRVRHLNNPVDLGVDRASYVESLGRFDVMPVYVRRDVTTDLRAKLKVSGFVLLSGDSTAGLTREAYEAVRSELGNHWLIAPQRLQDLPEALQLATRYRKCVLWLDDLERFLPGLDRMTVRRLVQRRGRHVVIVATMASVFLQPESGGSSWEMGLTDLLRQVREVLDLADKLFVERMWSADELERAEAVSGQDPRIASALRDSDDYGIAQHLAAGHMLVERWRSGRASVTNGGHPLGVAIVDAAVDARRLGFHDVLSEDLLQAIHGPYLKRRFGQHPATESWADAMAWATQVDQRVSGSSLLIPRPDGYRAFTYLIDVDDEFDHRRMPDSAWQALIAAADDETAASMAFSAGDLGDVHRTIEAMWRAADKGNSLAAVFAGIFIGRGGDTKVQEWLAVEIADAQRDLGPHHEETLWLRLLATIYEFLHDPREAAAQLQTLQAELPIEDDPDLVDLSLAMTLFQARMLFEGGDAAEAATLAETLVQQGIDAGWSPAQVTNVQLFRIGALGRDGRWRTAADVAIQLTAGCVRDFGSTDPLTLFARQWCGHALAHAGEVATAVGRLTSTLDDCLNVLGARDRVTLVTRMAHAEAIELNGEHSRAQELWSRLVSDAIGWLGAADGQTVDIRTHQLSLKRRLGDHDQLLVLEKQLVDDLVVTHGEGAFRTLAIRQQYAEDVTAAGRAAQALLLWEQLLPELARVYGADNSSTFRARGEWIDQVGEVGEVQRAAQLAVALADEIYLALPDDALLQAQSVTRAARWLAAAGDHPQAALWYDRQADLYADAYGAHEPITLVAQYNHAVQMGLSGRPQDASAKLAVLLPKFVSAHGQDHRDVWVVRAEQANWVTRADPRAGAELYQRIAADRGAQFDPADQLKVDCLINAARAWWSIGETDKAMQIFESMKPHLEVRITPAESEDQTTESD